MTHVESLESNDRLLVYHFPLVWSTLDFAALFILFKLLKLHLGH